MFTFVGTSGVLVTTYLLHLVYRLIRNIAKARRTGLPYLVCPSDPDSPLWQLVAVPLRPWLQRHLPSRVWNRLTLTIYGWEFYQKRQPFDEYAAPQGDSKSLLIASCGALELLTADPVLVTDVLQRVNDFEMPALTALFMGQFGHNVITTNGARWAKQRKVVAGVINERISKTIFDSTMSQTTALLEELQYIEDDRGTLSVDLTNLFDMVKRITIHVLSEAGMGIKAVWRHEDAENPPPNFKTTYMEACGIVMESGTGAIILPTRVLQIWPSFLPGHQKLTRLGIAKEEFSMHTRALLDEERNGSLSSKTPTGRGNIMSQLLRASAEQGDLKTGLTEEELNGNLFLFTAAGFETTANTLSYALILLARHPQWQAWLFDEVDSLMTVTKADLPEYSSVYPQVTRIMAVMLETLRLYTSVVHVLRCSKKSQDLNTSNGVVRLPAGTSIAIDNIALHLDPEVWRGVNRDSDPSFVTPDENGLPDESTFRPSRWINPSQSESPLHRPPRGSFVPWGYGPRVCPGQKMGQVEFAAVMLKLFQHHRIEAVPLPGESRAEVEQRLDSLLTNSVPKMTLTMPDIYNAHETGGLRMKLSKRN